MSEDLHTVMRAVHIALGGAGFVLGALAALLPKFGARASLHRLVGRIYGVSMLGVGALSVPLAANQGNVLLVFLGALTFGYVVVGWLAIRRARLTAAPKGRRNLTGLHIVMMGSSYGAAWTAFLLNVQPLGEGGWLFWLYAFSPSLVAFVLISRSLRQQARPLITAR